MNEYARARRGDQREVRPDLREPRSARAALVRAGGALRRRVRLRPPAHRRRPAAAGGATDGGTVERGARGVAAAGRMARCGASGRSGDGCVLAASSARA